VKKTAVDRFNYNREEESRRLNLKRKMEHDEKMASIRLKRHKYDLQYGSTGTPQTPGTSTSGPATAAATKEDKQIEILHLQIRLAELTRDNSAHASSSRRRVAVPLKCNMSHRLKGFQLQARVYPMPLSTTALSTTALSTTAL
jgi:hypothetical protein